jgi:hypothetical protein
MDKEKLYEEWKAEVASIKLEKLGGEKYIEYWLEYIEWLEDKLIEALNK